MWTGCWHPVLRDAAEHGQERGEPGAAGQEQHGALDIAQVEAAGRAAELHLRRVPGAASRRKPLIMPCGDVADKNSRLIRCPGQS